MTSVVLDASALLAMANAEPGADMVRASFMNAVISAVNYSEVLKKTIERGVATEPLIALVQGASLAVIPFETSLAKACAELYAHTKPHGLSFADRACLALGIQQRAPVLTADRRWQLIELPIKIRVIRNAN